MNGRRLVTDRYINPLTDFGSKRIFGTEPNSLKYYRDLNNVVDTSRPSCRDEGATRIIMRLLEKRFGLLSEPILKTIQSPSIKNRKRW